jgi:peptidoglycan/LPS O-acetylase OafA/YrhL
MHPAVAVALVTSPDASTRVVRRFRVVARIALFAGLFLVLALPVQVFIPTYLGVTFAGLIALVTGPKTRTSRGLVSLLERRPVVYLGRVSYSIYLWHFPIVIFLTDRFAEATTAWGLVVRVAVVLAVTVILSSITYRYVEAPAMRLARRLGSRRRDLELVGATS